MEAYEQSMQNQTRIIRGDELCDLLVQSKDKPLIKLINLVVQDERMSDLTGVKFVGSMDLGNTVFKEGTFRLFGFSLQSSLFLNKAIIEVGRHGAKTLEIREINVKGDIYFTEVSFPDNDDWFSLFFITTISCNVLFFDRSNFDYRFVIEHSEINSMISFYDSKLNQGLYLAHSRTNLLNLDKSVIATLFNIEISNCQQINVSSAQFILGAVKPTVN